MEEKIRDKKFGEPTALVDFPLRIQLTWALPSVRNFIAKGFYKRHGVDGMLLIFAYPPKESDIIHLRAHEKKLVKEAYLKERGGMTRKGIQLLHTLVPRETIVERATGKLPKRKK